LLRVCENLLPWVTKDGALNLFKFDAGVVHALMQARYQNSDWNGLPASQFGVLPAEPTSLCNVEAFLKGTRAAGTRRNDASIARWSASRSNSSFFWVNNVPDGLQNRYPARG
jgi:hypothetical protein